MVQKVTPIQSVSTKAENKTRIQNKGWQKQRVRQKEEDL
jgi:hypothetical protein